VNPKCHPEVSKDPEPVEGIFQPNNLAVIPYVMAGDPDLETTALVIDALRDAGADAIELGIPYGDPLADGPTIAAAGVRALRNGVAIADVLTLVKDATARKAPPIVLFTYFNPVYQYGIERFAKDAAEAGAAGAIVPDVALEEAQPLREALRCAGLAMPLLVAPSTSRQRAARIAGESTGFVYVVSRLGVTGAGAAPDFTPLRAQIATLRELTDKPLAVGFGISNAQHVREVREVVDGVIVGSAVIDAYAGTRGADAAARVKEFLEQLREGAPPRFPA
jgi:tryptophan synthase alpha chain